MNFYVNDLDLYKKAVESSIPVQSKLSIADTCGS